MELTEREKKVFREILAKGELDEEQLIDSGYYPSEIEQIKDDKEWFMLYGNADDKRMIDEAKRVAESVLGNDWKSKYDYRESRERGRYNFEIYINRDDFNKMCYEITR